MDTTIHNRDFIITGLQSWNITIGSNCKNIASEFAKTNRVLYINPPTDRITLLRRLTRKKTDEKVPNPIQVKPNLWVYTPQRVIESISRLPNDFLFDLLNKRNNQIFAGEIKKVIEKLEFKNYIHFCDSDMFRSFHLKELLSPELYIYYSRDNLLAVDYWKTQGTRIEPLHMRNADMVMANSIYLANKAGAHNPNSYFVGQGCDLSAFSEDKINTMPDDIAKIPGPVIGYIGSLNSLRLNISILEYVAEVKPEWNIVLIGPEDDKFKNSNLHKFNNVWFLGQKKEEQLPQYLKSFDVAINPQFINEITIGNYPRKIDEYLAMGKPVVATQTTAMGYFSEFVSLAKNIKDWVTLIDYELNNNSLEKKESRKEFAAQHTWENNVREIYHFIAEFHKHQSKNKVIQRVGISQVV